MFKTTLASLGVVCAMTISSGASAATFDFTYDFDSFVSVSGTFSGVDDGVSMVIDTLTATITSVGGVFGNVIYDIDSSTGNFLLHGEDGVGGAPFAPATMNLDGSAINLLVTTDTVDGACDLGFGFCINTAFTNSFGDALDSSASFTIPYFEDPTNPETGFELVGEFVPDNLTLDRVDVAVVPLPASLPLLAAGMALVGGLGAMRRRRARTV